MRWFRTLWLTLVHELRLAFVALQFLTRVPVPAWVGFEPPWLQACVRHFPTVGWLVGLWGAALMALASAWWPPVIAVGVGMAATVWLTGAFHEDGWADTCDGLGGTVSRARALEIMKDSRLGTYGVVGLGLMLGLKAGALFSLLNPAVAAFEVAGQAEWGRVLGWWTAMAWVSAHGLSRLAPVLLMATLPYAGDAEHAKARPLALHASGRTLLATVAWTALGLGLMAAVVLWQGWPWHTWWHAQLAGLAAVCLGTVAMHRLLSRRLGGFTGDTLGAAQQLCELACLLAWLPFVQPVA